MIVHRTVDQTSLRFDDGRHVILVRHDDHYHLLVDGGEYDATSVDILLSVLETGPDPSDVDLLTMLGTKLN